MSACLFRMTGLLALALFIPGTLTYAQHYNETNLVTNSTDSSLVNPWGLARSSSSPWWVSDNRTGMSTIYNGLGTKLGLKVKIPAAVSGKTGTPTGVIYNGSTTDFLLPGGKPAAFIFCTLDGLIVGWNFSAGVVTEVKTTNHSSYTGLTSAVVNGRRYLYAANFNTGHVDVYDNMFHPVHMQPDNQDGMFMGGGQTFMGGDQGFMHGDQGYNDGRGFMDGGPAFMDDHLPEDYVPFNVQAIGNDIVVTYALHEEGSLFETDGPGLGYVDIYSADGRMLQRLQHGDWLNAPWGVALAPLDFGMFSHDLLVAQFAGGGPTESSGYIAAYDMTTGRFLGLLEDASGNPLAINGVWAITPGNGATAAGTSTPSNYDPAGAPASELYFTAGPNHASGGVLGYLTPNSTELVQGNDQ